MSKDNVIQIHTDGAMDLDTKQTGGTSFVINFPESLGIQNIEENNWGQGQNKLKGPEFFDACVK